MAYRSVSYKEEQHITEMNEKQFEELVATFMPDLYMLWSVIKLYELNTEAMLPVMRAIGELAQTTKFGEVMIEIRPDKETGEPTIRRVQAVDTTFIGLVAHRKT